MRLNKKNLSKMTSSQKARYTRHLALVRKYTRDKYEYQRKVKKGELKDVTLQQYRDSKHGKGQLRSQPALTLTKMAEEAITHSEDQDLIEKLERLLRNLKEVAVIKKQLKGKI